MRGKAIEAASAALEVTPEEAERLAVAVNQGSIQLVLRATAIPTAFGRRGPTRPTPFAARERADAHRRGAESAAPQRAAGCAGDGGTGARPGEARFAHGHHLPRYRQAAAEVRKSQDGAAELIARGNPSPRARFPHWSTIS